MNNGGRVVYEFSGFRLDPALRILLHNGEPVTVWPKVFDTLRLLVESSGRVVNKEELMQALWPDSFVEESNLTQNVFLLRKILGDDGNGHSFIQTVHRRGYKFVASVQELEPPAAESGFSAEYWEHRSPFRGLQVFETEDAWLFFGREPETAELLAGLKRSPVLSVVGNSGSGKSSLLRAGLIPALQHGHFCPNGSANQQWRIAVFRPSVAPFDYLAEVLPGQLAPELSLQERAEFIHQFRNQLSSGGDSVRDAVAALAGAAAHEASPTRVLLVADQFEEIFTLAENSRVRDAYIDSLLAAARPGGAVPVHLVLAVRADFYAECMEHAELSRSMAANQYNVGRMRHEQLRESIVRRLQLASAQAEAGLIDSLLEDAGSEPGNLALLEHALGQLWEKCGGFGGTLTNAAYAEIGRLRGALGRHADEVYAGLLDDDQKQLAKKILLELVHVGDGAQDARRRVAKSDLLSLDKPEQVELLLSHLASARLISTGGEEKEGYVEVSHEALIREWPLLREWLAENREDLRLERRLLQAAEEWGSLNREKGALLQGARLAQAEEWLSRHADAPVLLRDFVQASLAARKESEERELAQERAAATRLRWFSLGLAVLLLIAVATAAYVYHQRIIEKSRALAAQSGELLQQDHGRALDLAIRSWETAQTKEAAFALSRAVPEPLAILKHDGSVETASFSPDDRLVVTASYDHTARVWDGATGQLLFTLSGHTDKLESAEFSPDGKQILTVSDDHTARLWSSADGHLQFTLRGHSERVWRAAFSPDSTRVVTASADKTARIWSTADGHLIKILQGHTNDVSGAVFSRDGRLIVTASWDHTAAVWSVEGRLLMRLQHNSEVICAAFSPDGKTIATGTFNGMTNLWNSVDGTLRFGLQAKDVISSIEYSADGQRIVIGGHGGARIWSNSNGKLLLTLSDEAVPQVRFSPDGTHIVGAGLDHQTRVWSSSDGGLLATLQGHLGPMQDAEFSRDGQRLVTASQDQTVRIWNLNSARSLVTLQGHAGYVVSATFSPDARRVLTASWDHTGALWDSSEGSLLARLNGHTDRINFAQISPDGQRIVTTSYDHTARIWNASNGRPLHVLAGHSDCIWGAQFSPDGQRIVTASFDHTARLWNAADGSLIAILQGHSDKVINAQFSPDGRTIVTASYDHTARLWSATDGRPLITLNGHTDKVSSAKFSPDGQRIVTSSYDNTSRIWRSADGRLQTTLTGPSGSGRVLTAQFSPDGKRVVSASFDSTAKVWDVSDGRLLLTLRGHNDAVLIAQFSADGQRIITTAQDNTVRVWNSTDGRLIATLQGHSSPVYSVQFSPDGERILTGSLDSTARIWQVVTLEDVRRMLGH